MKWSPLWASETPVPPVSSPTPLITTSFLFVVPLPEPTHKSQYFPWNGFWMSFWCLLSSCRLSPSHIHPQVSLSRWFLSSVLLSFRLFLPNSNEIFSYGNSSNFCLVESEVIIYFFINSANTYGASAPGDPVVNLWSAQLWLKGRRWQRDDNEPDVLKGEPLVRWEHM